MIEHFSDKSFVLHCINCKRAGHGFKIMVHHYKIYRKTILSIHLRSASRSRAEVGMLFGISRRKTEDFFQHCVVKDEDLGDLQIMTLVTEMYGLLFEWADFTGYPVMPFRRSVWQLKYICILKNIVWNMSLIYIPE